ncbi:hypothetical protein O2K51_14545 [Apibacter raozihei]|uniref:hypothetical protein n=1 Tax=Apibacter raozihei TaxID=2500547 RepID=UPI000FE3B449|nr:hypothetical protein [Apibacter raozihei]
MKQLFYKQPSPKYKDLEFNELKQVLFQTNSSRNKVPILINLGLLNESKELYELLLNEVKNKDNIKTKEFSTLTVAMIAAIGVIQLGNEEYLNKLKEIISKSWDNYSKEDFIRILKSEGIKFDL